MKKKTKTTRTAGRGKKPKVCIVCVCRDVTADMVADPAALSRGACVATMMHLLRYGKADTLYGLCDDHRKIVDAARQKLA